MKKLAEFKVSDQAKLYIKNAIDDFAEEIKRELEIIGADGARFSIDFNFAMPGKLVGVKYRLFKSEEAEVIYDFDLPKK